MMKPNGSILMGIICVAVAVCAALPAHSLTQEEREAGFEALFDGNNMDKWFTLGERNTFSVENSILTCSGEGGVVLRTKEVFEDYILRLSYKISEGGNSGVFLHAVDHARDSRVGGEIQVLDSHGRDPSPHIAGALYDVHAPQVNAARPHDQWNELEIHFEWPRLHVKLNGEVVQDIDDLRDNHKTRYRVRFGNIGLQDHGSPAWYRNIRIKDLGGNARDSWISLMEDDELNDLETDQPPQGWVSIGDGNWHYDEQGGDRVLQINRGEGALIYTEAYQNFALWGYVRTSGRGYGAICTRWNGVNDKGYQVLLNHDKFAELATGTIKDLVPVEDLIVDHDAWAPMKIVVRDDVITVLVNGTIVAEYLPIDVRKGNIALLRDSCCGEVELKDLRIKPLPTTLAMD